MTSNTSDSPCIKVCVVDLESGYCIGCGRSRLEIASWTGFSAEQRGEVVARLPQRLKDMTAGRRRKGGRKRRRDMGA